MTTITHHNVAYAGDKNIHYLATGPVDGPLILFVHGWPATAITWKTQLDACAAVGFRAVAPDMPGYGQSTARRVADDYTQEAIVEGMMALLADTGRKAAVWVGHDWGSGVTSSVAIQHPETVKALVSTCIPYSTIELGWDGFFPLINRDIYPADEYEYGQWDYMKLYEENFEGTVAGYEKDIAAFAKGVMQRPTSRPDRTLPAPTANVRKLGRARFGGPGAGESSSMLPDDVVESYVKDMQTTGLWPGSAYYLHHKRNAEYNGNRDRRLKQPVMFIHATWDIICDTKTSRLIEPMREACSNLTEVTIDSSHWVPFEKPREFNAALFRFILTSLPSEWPGFWDSGFTKLQSAL